MNNFGGCWDLINGYTPVHTYCLVGLFGDNNAQTYT